VEIAFDDLQLREAPDQGREGRESNQDQPAITLSEFADVGALD
jgi:hypothetical protein